MIATLLRFVGIDLERLARDAAITVALAMAGVFAAILALALGCVALYLWLALELGTFAALGVLGGSAALLAIVLFAVAFWRAPRKPRAQAGDTLRAPAVPDSSAVLARTADEVMRGAAEIVRNGSGQQIAGTVAVAVLVGWLLARRSGRP